MTAIPANFPAPKRRRHSWRKTIEGYLFIGPVVLGLIIWTFGPMIASAYYSLTDYRIVQPPEFIGFGNYIELFTTDRLFIQSLSVTVRYGLMFMVLGQIVSLLLAVLLTQKVRGMAIFRTFFYMPIIVPYVASALLWRYLYNKDFGPINAVLQAIGLDPINWLGSPESSLFSMVIMSVWTGAVTTIIYVAGLQQIPEDLHDAAKIDGANAVQRFFAVTIPMLSPTIFFNVVTGFIGSFQFFVPAFLMTDGGPIKSTYFYNLNIYEKAFRWLEMGYASAMAWVLFIIIMAITVVLFRVSNRWVYYEGSNER
ncbi:MAG: sugar ABC transporter permease [Pleurocapsa minor GSE-CHR-MK-17-07R]|jgi:multiple sugar transport system permease protein|nr:sugar ABC transporter permease [Pleurocapsa minor GSE-CHR-MK 17-07R]